MAVVEKKFNVLSGCSCPSFFLLGVWQGVPGWVWGGGVGWGGGGFVLVLVVLPLRVFLLREPCPEFLGKFSPSSFRTSSSSAFFSFSCPSPPLGWTSDLSVVDDFSSLPELFSLSKDAMTSRLRMKMRNSHVVRLWWPPPQW